jgi:hypothetical protein
VYEHHKKDKATKDILGRIVNELFHAIAAGQVDTLVQAGVIKKEKHKGITKKLTSDATKPHYAKRRKRMNVT